MAGAGSGCAAQDDEGRLDGKASTCCEEIVFGKRLGAETTLRQTGATRKIGFHGLEKGGGEASIGVVC